VIVHPFASIVRLRLRRLGVRGVPRGPHLTRDSGAHPARLLGAQYGLV